MEDEKKYANEIMSDKELDNVAGGSWVQTCDDSVHLHHYGLCRYRYGEFTNSETMSYFQSSIFAEADVKQAWKKVGVDFVPSFDRDNKYFINGKEVTHQEAMNHLNKFFDDKDTVSCG